MFDTNKDLLTLQNKLNNHPVYESIQTIEDLRCFVEHHIYSVWDFMSLVKYLQHHIAPASYPWFPNANGNLRRFINEIVLEEESDETLIEGQHLSHFEIYQQAMEEIGANTSTSKSFINTVKNSNLEKALELSIPLPAKKFIETTFNFIKSDQLHIIASAFTFGRETIIPKMFISILDKLGVRDNECPTFYYYIKRHIEVDDEKHGPMALNLINTICNDNNEMKKVVFDTAIIAMQARLNFWDGVLEAIKSKKLINV